MADRRFDLVEVTGVFFLTDPETEAIHGTFFPNGGGWWKGRAPGGEVREVFVKPEVADPVKHVARRMTAP